MSEELTVAQCRSYEPGRGFRCESHEGHGGWHVNGSGRWSSRTAEEIQGSGIDRILWNRRPKNDGGDIDEIVVHGCIVHIEQMDDRCWWIGITKGADYWSGNLHCDSRGRMTFSEQDDDLPWDLDGEHPGRGETPAP